jgi:glutathione S-transferase
MSRSLLRAFTTLSAVIEIIATTMAAAETTTPEWTVHFHQPGVFKGRGEFLRLMLEDKGVSYLNTSEGCYTTDMFRKSHTDIAEAETDVFPTLYPPMIRHRPTDGSPPVLVNQVGACMIYLGDQLGYAPASSAERARANAILLNCLDFISDGRSAFHPIKNTMSYSEQKEEGDKVSLEFSKTRMLKYLHHLEKVVQLAGSSENPVAGGDQLTYADFALFHVLDATASQFDSEHYGQAWTNAKLPLLKAYHAWIKSRPNLQAYFQSDRCARK